MDAESTRTPPSSPRGERRYECGRCGGRITTSTSIKSKATGVRYCRDMQACDRRARRRKTKEAK